MLPQIPAIPIQTTEASSDTSRSLNQLLPVGKNVSATVVAVSRDQVQPEIFKLQLEINNRLIQMGVFQALPVGQKINVNRQSDGQIQLTPQPAQSQTATTPDKAAAQTQTSAREGAANAQQQTRDINLKLQLPNIATSNKIPDEGRVLAAVISSRPIFPKAEAALNTSPRTTANIPQGSSQASGAISATSITSQASNQTTVQSPQVNQSIPSPTGRESITNPQAQTTIQSTPSNTSVNQQLGASNSTPSLSTSQPASPTSITGSTIQSPTQQSATNPTPQPVSQNNAAPGQTTQQAPTPTQSSVQPQPPQPNQTPPSAQTSQAVAIDRATQTSRQSTQPGQSNPAPQNTQTTQTTQPVTEQRNTSPPQNPPALQATANTARAQAAPTHHLITLALPNGSKVEFNSPQPLPQGSQILLQKNSASDVQVLKIQYPNLTQSSALEKPAIQEILRNSLPVQLPAGDAFSQLAQAAAKAEGSAASQISSVVRSMLSLFGVSPGSQDAPSQIKQNIQLGGMHTERTLSEGKSPPPQDMKSQLQQLQNLADKLPEEQRERFEQLLRGLHSRVTSQQLNSLQQWRELPDGGFERVIQLDLPIKQGDKWDNLELRLSREGGNNADGELITVWRVRLHFDLDELGGVDAEIRLSDEHEISTLFWCDQEKTAELLRGKADQFAERLRECGFSNSEVQWHQGTAPAQNQPIHKQLIDLHT